MQKRVEQKKNDVRQNLAECWNSFRNKVEFAEHGKSSARAQALRQPNDDDDGGGGGGGGEDGGQPNDLDVCCSQVMLGVVTQSALSS